jgi:hypothetical protein
VLLRKGGKEKDGRRKEEKGRIIAKTSERKGEKGKQKTEDCKGNSPKTVTLRAGCFASHGIVSEPKVRSAENVSEARTCRKGANGPIGPPW